MASPYTGKKLKWPSDNKKAGVSAGDVVSDFVPYISNIANMFRKTPRPMAPQLINPITGQKVSLANSRQAIEDSSRVADLSTAGLDAQTAAAIRTGNMSNKLRALSDVNSREALANAQIINQTNQFNSGIEAQNARMINDYQDDLVNAQLTENRIKSENIANAADKFIGQRATKDQMKLERDKINIMSKTFNPGVYSRLINKLDETGTSIPGQEPAPTNVFNQYKSAPIVSLKPKSATPKTTGIPNKSAADTDISTDTSPFDVYKRKKLYKFAAGGMMGTLGAGDPTKPLIKDPVSTPKQFKGDRSITGVTATGDNYAMNFGTNRTARGIDVVNQLISKGILPHNTESPTNIRSLLDPKMYSYIYQFNQRPDLTGMNPEQRLQSFYNITSNDPDVQAMKENMRRFGYGPMEFNRTSPLNIQPAMKTAKRSYGGKMIKPFR